MSEPKINARLLKKALQEALARGQELIVSFDSDVGLYVARTYHEAKPAFLGEGETVDDALDDLLSQMRSGR